MYFPLDKLLDYKGNKYELTRACIEYAKKVRILGVEEYILSGEKDALVALKAVLEGDIKFIVKDNLSLENYEEDIVDFLDENNDVASE